MALVATHSAQAQTCPTQLGNLNVCAPFVLPGAPATSPSTECCSALHAVEQDCLCNTLRIASRLPTLCNLPPLSCNGKFLCRAVTESGLTQNWSNNPGHLA
ncbi:hypothetical protein NMG60_11011868 [Bertholletia excelsa]